MTWSARREERDRIEGWESSVAATDATATDSTVTAARPYRPEEEISRGARRTVRAWCDALHYSFLAWLRKPPLTRHRALHRALTCLEQCYREAIMGCMRREPRIPQQLVSLSLTHPLASLSLSLSISSYRESRQAVSYVVPPTSIADDPTITTSLLPTPISSYRRGYYDVYGYEWESTWQLFLTPLRDHLHFLLEYIEQ